MNFIKSLIADLSIGLSVHDLPVILFQFFISLLLASIFKWLIFRNIPNIPYFIPLVLCSTAAGIIAKTGIQGAVVGLALFIIVSKFLTNNNGESRLFLLAIPTALLCGYSQVVIALLYSVLSISFILLSKNKK